MMTRVSGALIWMVVLMTPVFMTGCFIAGVDPLGERLTAAQDEIMDQAEREDLPADLTLSAAVEYALRNNLSLRAAELEHAIEQEVRTSAILKMLPSLQANIGVTERNRLSASSSMGLTTGEESLRPSYSSEKLSRPSDITMVWSIMDFGLSAIRARQSEERIRIAEENLRRLRQQIVMETTIAYHRLRAADSILREYATLEKEIEDQLAYYQEQVADRSLSENEQARRTMPLLVGLKTLNDLVWERQSASANLAKAIGAAQLQEISLAAAEDSWDTPNPADLDVEDLYELALNSRPEMYRADSETRMSLLEAKAALLQIAPNVSLTASAHHDPNRFLVYNNWLEAGVRATWDLLRLPARIKDAKTAGQRAELTSLRRTIAAASILIQVNLALLELDQTARRVKYLGAIEANRRVLIRGMEEAMESGKAHQVDVLSERIRHMSEFSSYAWARSDRLAAFARLVSGLGLDPHTTRLPDWLVAVKVEETLPEPTPVPVVVHSSPPPAPQPELETVSVQPDRAVFKLKMDN